MARNGSGTYSRVGSPYSYNTVIDQVAVNAEMDDIATALTGSLAKNGETTPTANLPMGTFRHTGVGNGVARTDYPSMGQVQDGKINWVDGGGTADAITATYSPAITALVDGQVCYVRATAANATTTPTFAPNGLTARTIVKTGGVALVAGDIVGDGHELILRYDLANTRWELLNPSGLSSGSASQVFSVGTATAVAHAVRLDQIQQQYVTAYTTGGTSTAYTITTLGAISLVSGERWRIKFNQTAGATPTLNRDSKGAKSLKLYDSTGAKVAASASTIVANMLTDVEYDGTDYVILDPLPTTTTFATDAEVRTGTSTVLAVNPANIKATQIGWGQAWVNYVTAGTGSDRLTNTTYTNTSGRPIMVAITWSGSGTTISCEGVIVAYISGTDYGRAIFIVPNGSTYIANSGASIYYWSELR